MKIGIPCTDAAGGQSRLHTSFSEAPFFALWDTALEQLEFKRNSLADHESACTYAAGRWLQKQGAEAMICAAIGHRAAERLSQDGMHIWLSPTAELDALFNQYRNGALGHRSGAVHTACCRQKHSHHGQLQPHRGCGRAQDYPTQGGDHRQGCQAHPDSGGHD
jgi:predicted Fe-Mo cluster-binding NifX family protein